MLDEIWAAESPLATAMAVIVAILLGRIGAIAIHELGHALAARVVGIPMRLVRIGGGKTLFSFVIGSARVSLRAPPLGGSAIPYATYHVGRFARAVFFLGGAALNAFAALVLFWAADSVADMSALFGLSLTVAGAVQAFSLLNLLRFRLRRPIENVLLPDGGLLLALIGQDQTPFKKSRAGALARFAAYGEPPAYLDAAAVRVLYFVDAAPGATPGERQRHYEDLERERRRRHTPSVHLLLLDGVVTQMLYLDGEADAARLDDWSYELVTLAPSNKTVRGTRAAALAFIGRYREARPELAALLEDASGFDRYICAAGLARAEFGLGNRTAAKQALDICYAVAEATPHLRATTAWPLTESFAARIGYRQPEQAPS